MRRIAELDAECAARRGDAEVLISESPDQVEGLLRLLLLCEPQGVGLDLCLDRRAHVWRCAKEAIRRHQAIDALMRSLKVVVLDEERDSPQPVGKVGEHRLAEKLLPQRLPEALDLSERLRVLRPALAVLDPPPAQELLKFGLAAPGGVLPALIRQHLARLAILRNPALQRLDDQTGLLVMGHCPRHQIARVVVHEAYEVDALMAS